MIPAGEKRCLKQSTEEERGENGSSEKGWRETLSANINGAPAERTKTG